MAILFTDIVDSTGLSQRLSAELPTSPSGPLLDPPSGHHRGRRHRGQEPGRRGDGGLRFGVRRPGLRGGHAAGCRAGQPGPWTTWDCGSDERREVTREDDDYFGDPVVEAARLCAPVPGRPGPGRRRRAAMAGRRSRHEWRSVGELALKGLP